MNQADSVRANKRETMHKTAEPHVGQSLRAHAPAKLAIWIICTCVVLGSSTGCAVLRNFPHNYTCPPRSRSGCNDSCKPNCTESHDVVTDDGYVSQGAPFPAAVQLEELSALREQMATMEAKDTSLQEQLAMLDSNAEKRRQAHEATLQEMRDLASKVSSMQMDVKTQKGELEQVRTTLIEQRVKHEQVLASIEQELVDVLQDYQ